MASAPICFSPPTLACQASRNPRKTSPRTPSQNPNGNPKLKSRSTPQRSRPLPASSPGGEATTYTRLPLREDFFNPSLDPSRFFSTEVKLSDSAAAVGTKSLLGEIERGIDESGSEEEDVDGELDSSYEKLDEFEGDCASEVEPENVLEGVAEEGEEEMEKKEKGIPAVMRCFDRAKIYAKAGDGGNGVVAFRREKFVPFGGPSGGDGGRGGNVYVEVDGSMNSLLPFRKNIHFRAGRGAHGQGKMQIGAKGEDVVVKVAPGTVIREAYKNGVVGEVLLELLHPGQRALLLPGGRGGRGNASFKSGSNKVPKIAEHGEEGPEM